jgi:hypothetical protein
MLSYLQACGKSVLKPYAVNVSDALTKTLNKEVLDLNFVTRDPASLVRDILAAVPQLGHFLNNTLKPFLASQ